MNLIDLKPVQAERAQSLEELLAEASSLGWIYVSRWHNNAMWDATLKVNLPRGTEVKVEAKNTNLAFAVADCINQARSFGA